MSTTTGTIIKLGITGGIGSGKTTVCRVFNVLGIPVFSADFEARRIQNTDIEIRAKINSLAGKDLYRTGTLNRAELAKLIFNNRELLEKVNSVVHPAVFKYFFEWEAQQPAPYVIMEAAILFESGASKLVDRILTVVTPVNERIERVIRSNNMTRDQVIERINNQIDDETRMKKSDYIIYNSENDMIIPGILGVHEEMMDLANKTK